MSNATYPNPGIKWGLIAGAAVIGTGLVLHNVDEQAFFSLKFNFIQLAICAVFGLLAGWEKKRQLGGFIGFKSSLQPIFTTFVIATLFGTILSYVVINYVDPELPARMKAYDLKMTQELKQAHKDMGITDAEVNDRLTKIQQQDYTVTFVASMLSYFTGLFLDFVVSAILAVIIRKKQFA